MDTQHLKYFVEIVNCKNFTRAAEQLFITQPMLTKVIKQLEYEVGAKLIERTCKSFRLTDVGEVFFSRALELLNRYGDLQRAIEDIKAARTGAVRYSIPGVLLDIYFPPLLAEFCTSNPGIDMSIVEEGSKLVMQSVLNEESDFGLVMLPIASSDRFDIRLVVSSDCRLLVPRAHPFAKRQSVHVQELEEEKILTFSDTATLHDTFISHCEAHDFLPRLAYKSLMPNFSFRMVSLEQCIAVLPAPIIQKYITDDLTCVPLEPVIKWDIAVISKKNRYQSFVTNKLIQFIFQYFDTHYAAVQS